MHPLNKLLGRLKHPSSIFRGWDKGFAFLSGPCCLTLLGSRLVLERSSLYTGFSSSSVLTLSMASGPLGSCSPWESTGRRGGKLYTLTSSLCPVPSFFHFRDAELRVRSAQDLLVTTVKHITKSQYRADCSRFGLWIGFLSFGRDFFSSFFLCINI